MKINKIEDSNRRYQIELINAKKQSFFNERGSVFIGLCYDKDNEFIIAATIVQTYSKI